MFSFKRRGRKVPAVIFLFVFCSQALAQENYAGMSLEELMNIEVYSASKKSERLQDIAAAVTVITPDDIRRSGATTIPEVLRLVPGIRVQKTNSHAWDISIRGFNGSTYANKLLVLIDGRSVYTPLYAGVIWSLQDVVLEDVERIEVVRGPGGTMWGANAVNGIINILTKKPKDTQGTLLSFGAGTEERGFVTARYGGKTGDWFYRSYAKYANRDEGFKSDGTNVDDWSTAQTGFRTEKDKLNLQGDFYLLRGDQLSTLTSLTAPYTRTFKDSAEALGANLMSTYTDDDWFFKMYWDMTDIRTSPLTERRDQIELEYTRLVPLGANQDLNWGLGYRLQLEDVDNTFTNTINKSEATDHLFSFFIQDEIRAMQDKLKFIVGSKLEHNIYTGIEVQPNVRTLYHINETNQVWAAASRAVRTPSRLENDGTVIAQLSATPTFQRVLPNRDVESEDMSGFELGYRTEPNKNMMFDLALFANFYDELIALDYGRFTVGSEGGFLVARIPTANAMKGEVHGVEFSTDVKITDWWKMKGYYSFIKQCLQMEKGFRDMGLPAALNEAVPAHSYYVRSSFDLPHGFELDATFRYTSRFYFGRVPSVAELDIHLGKKIKGWEVAFVGQNLIEAHHKETVLGGTQTQVERGYYLKLTRRF